MKIVEGTSSPYRALTEAIAAQPTRPKKEGGQIGQADQAGDEMKKPAAPPEKVEQAVKQINDYLQIVQRNLQFSVDKDTKQVVVKVIDAKSGEVVRQIPPESALEMARNMEKLKADQGLLFAQQA